MEFVFVMDLEYTVLSGIQVSTKISVLPSGTLSQNTDLENFATAYRSSKRAVNLARQRRRRSERDKLDRRRSAKLTISATVDR